MNSVFISVVKIGIDISIVNGRKGIAPINDGIDPQREEREPRPAAVALLSLIPLPLRTQLVGMRMAGSGLTVWLPMKLIVRKPGTGALAFLGR